MIINTIFRMLWVTIALMLAVGAALAVLFTLGAMWVGDELRAASPNDPMLQHRDPGAHDSPGACRNH